MNKYQRSPILNITRDRAKAHTQNKMKMTLFIFIAINTLTIFAEEQPVAWSEAFEKEQLLRLKERGIELPSGHKGVQEKQLHDFLNPTQLEMLRSRLAHPIKTLKEAEELTKRYERGDFD